MTDARFLGAKLGWFPTGGGSDPSAHYTGFSVVVDRARHLVLPVATLTLGYLGSYSLIMRTSMLDTLQPQASYFLAVSSCVTALVFVESWMSFES